MSNRRYLWVQIFFYKSSSFAASEPPLSLAMKFFTCVIFVALIRFHMHTFTHQRHEPPHYNTTNRYNVFTDIHHYNSFHLVPNSTMHVPSHLLIILNSSIRFRPRSSYPLSLFHTGNPCSLILLLLVGDVELNPQMPKVFRQPKTPKGGLIQPPLDFCHPVRIFWKCFSWVCFRGQGIQRW